VLASFVHTLSMPSGKLQVVPLGGLGEFGMNCMALRWGDDIIVIDAGLMFPEAELLGVDIVVPDISYLVENRQRVRAIILTHGHVIHTRDFKVDPTPTDNRLFDLHSFAEYGKEGVLALFQDSTNVERKGYTPSERAVRRKFDEIFAHTKRRLFISCFSSSIHRIKLAVELAHAHGRKVA